LIFIDDSVVHKHKCLKYTVHGHIESISCYGCYGGQECYRVLLWPEYDSRLCSNNILELVFLRENTLDIFLYKICTFDYLNVIYFSIATLSVSLNPASPFLILPRQ